MNYYLIAILCFLTACAPQVTKLSDPSVQLKRGPRNSDTVLKIRPDVLDPEALFWEQEIDTVDLFNSAESLILAGQHSGSVKIENIGHRISNSFYNTPGTTTEIQPDESPFIEAAIREVGPMIKAELDDIIILLSQQRSLISKALNAIPRKSPVESPPPSALAIMIEQDLNFILKYLEASGLDPMVYEAIVKEFNLTIKPNLATARSLGREIESAPTFSQALSKLSGLLEIYQYSPTAELKDKLAKCAAISAQIDRMQSEQQALTVIVEFWNMMTPEERVENIASVSDDLYDFLNRQDKKDLQCLASDSCGRIFMGIAKTKIFKQIRKEGVDSLRSNFNQGAKNSLINELKGAAPGIIQDLPKSFEQQVTSSIDKKIAELTFIQNNFREHAKQLFKQWTQSQLFYGENLSLKGAELERLKVKISKNRIQIKPLTQNKETGPAALGSAMSLSALRWNVAPATDGTRSRAQLKNSLEQINKMLAIIGYAGPNSNEFPSYLVSLGGGNHHIDFEPEKILSGQTGVVIPDKLRLRSGFAIDDNLTKKNVSVRSQAELLRGVSRMLENFKDWESSSYDLALGSVKLSELNIADLPTSLSEERLFPKSSLYAMAVGNAALVLHNLTKDLTPIFLADVQGNTFWADKWAEGGMGTTSAAMAGIVDIIDGKRSPILKSRDVSRYILALSEFYLATEGIEKTSSEILIKIDSKTNRAPLDVLKEARPKIKSLIVGLSNFLTHQLQDKDGGVVRSLVLDDTLSRERMPTDNRKHLIDQALAIKALLTASNTLGTKIYQWSAIEIYYFMNAHLWNSETQFYNTSEDNPGSLFLNQTNSMESLLLMKAVLDGKSNQQLEKIINLNLNRMEKSL